VYLGSPGNAVFFEPVYDVLERVVSLRPTAPLEPGVLYTVEVSAPESDPNGFGFAAFDGAPLSQQGPVPLRFQFRTAREGSGSAGERTAPACADVLRRFNGDGACSGGACHGAGSVLDLSSAAGLAAALRRPARQTDVGPNGGRRLLDPDRFGVGMPLIEPRAAATSYLVYKLLIRAESFTGGDCSSRYRVGFGPTCLFSSDESERLRDWFVVGSPMPPEHAEPGFGVADVDLVYDWIQAGALLEDCD
jgi:hypothetical protein